MKKIFSFFAAMMLLVSAVSATTIYCKMDKAWWTVDGAAVAVHHWGGETAATTWPGVRMTPVDEQAGIWSYDVPADVTGLVFARVNGGTGAVEDWGAKTADLTLPTDGKNLYTITSETAVWGNPGVTGVWSVYGEEPVEPETPVETGLPQVGLGASFNNWAWNTNLFTPAEDSLTASITVALEAGDHQFKVVSDGNWLSKYGEDGSYNLHRDWSTADHVDVVNGDCPDLALNADVAGDYTFTWTYADSTLAITFPAAAPVVLEAPAAAPAAPEYPIYQVKPVYSATYEADCGFGEWGSGTAYTQEEFGKKYVTTNLGYFGLEFTGMDCSEMEALHMDVWVAADASIRIVPIHGGAEVGVTAQLEGQKWNSINIALSEFAGVTNWSNVYQIKIDNASNLTFWVNNVYFYTTVVPTVDLEDGYYLIGRKGWTVYDIVATEKFAANAEAEGEFMLATTLADGDHFKVVAVANNEITTWYPDGMNNEYVVDIYHAGEKTIYFRPAGGQEGWHHGVIFVPEDVNANPFTTWFASYDTWNTETESYLEWDSENHKATIHINVDKYGQWRAQVKYQGPVAEAGKCYRLALKMKANHALNNVTVKYQDDVQMIYHADIALEENVEYVFDETAAGIAGGNGLLVLDFGFAKAGDIIEIYDFAITEVECGDVPQPETHYYLVGSITDWAVVADEAHTFVANEANAGEYMLSFTLAEGDAIKVVGVTGETQTWYPDDYNGAYTIDAVHAGTVTIYFRPEGGVDGWHYGYFYVAEPTGINNTAIDAKVVKTIINGQLFIEKNGKLYNAQGVQVK